MEAPAQEKQVDAIVAGHICLDIIPQLNEAQVRAEDLYVPGGLVQVGPATVTLGGTVANTGIALHRLGATTRLMGKVGDDLLGATLMEALRRIDAGLAEGIIVAPGESTSYTVVISPPGGDRGFIHCCGANDTYCGKDLESESLLDARLVHFGYPPLLKQFLGDGGKDLARIFGQVQQSGALVSLDMTMPDINSPQGQMDWKAWLARVLPSVDFFLPSFEEIVFMLDPGRFHQLAEKAGGENLAAMVDLDFLKQTAEVLIDLGCPLVAIKLGDCGIYLQTDPEAARHLESRSAWQSMDWQAWQGRRLWTPCFDLEVAGTNGAGDCTIAGMIMALLQGLTPDQAMIHCTSVGAWCVQSPDATSNIPHWSEIKKGMPEPWPLREPNYPLDGWTRCEETGVYSAPDA